MDQILYLIEPTQQDPENIKNFQKFRHLLRDPIYRSGFDHQLRPTHANLCISDRNKPSDITISSVIEHRQNPGL